MENYRIRSASGWTMFIFGLLAFLLGLLGLVHPEVLLTMLGQTAHNQTQRASGDYAVVFLIAAAMASFNVGAYYMLAALNDMRQFYSWTVPFRLVTFTVFTVTAVTHLAPLRFILLGAWEGLGAAATALALYYEKPHQPTPRRA
jgi:Na+-driven multidrug efflux pump